MNKFYTYTIRQFVKNLIIVTLLILIILLLSSFYGIINTLSGYDHNMVDVIRISIATMLVDINSIIPMIAAVTVIVTMLILMRSNELLAYMTVGGSVARLIFPFLFIGICLTSVMIYIEYKVVPEARLYKDVELKKIKNGVSFTQNITGFSNTWFVGNDKIITNIGFVSISDKKVYNVKEYFMDGNKIKNIVEIEVISKQGDKWVADNITVNKILTNPPVIEHIESRVLKEGTSIWEQMMSLSTTNEKALTPKELITMIELSKDKGISSTQYEISFYSKIASALSVIVLIIFLFPMSIDFSRNYSIVKNTAISFTFALVFVIAQLIGKSLGESGVLTPIPATFGPLLLFLIISLLLIIKRSRAK